jgi:hypothetical protein
MNLYKALEQAKVPVNKLRSVNEVLRIYVKQQEENLKERAKLEDALTEVDTKLSDTSEESFEHIVLSSHRDEIKRLLRKIERSQPLLDDCKDFISKVEKIV